MSHVATAPAVARPARLDRGTMLQWGVAAFTVILVVGPLVPIILQSLMAKPLYDGFGAFSLANYRELFTSQAVGGAVVNSLIFAFLTTVLALVIGAAAAIAVGRTDIPGAKVMGELLLWPLYLSQLVMAFGFSIMYGPSGYLTLAAQSAVGATPWNRDLIDRRIVADVIEGRGEIIDSQEQVGGYPQYKEARKPFVESEWNLDTMEPASGHYPRGEPLR